MKPNPAILFLLSFFVFATCCKKHADEPEPTPDPCVVNPCSCKKPVSAEFVMEEHLGSPTDTNYFETDTIIYYNKVRLIAKEDNAQYTWKVGTDTTTFTNKSFEILFTDKEINQTIPVTLFINKQPDTACFPNDNGKDTLTRYITVKARCDVAFQGSYNGYWTNNPADTFTIIIEMVMDSNDNTPPFYECNYIRIYNFDKNNCVSLLGGIGISLAYNNFEFGGGTIACMAPYGLGGLNKDDKSQITIDYMLFTDTTYTIKKTVKFIGTRK